MSAGLFLCMNSTSQPPGSYIVLACCDTAKYSSMIEVASQLFQHVLAMGNGRVITLLVPVDAHCTGANNMASSPKLYYALFNSRIHT